jgi:hypothetical protein
MKPLLIQPGHCFSPPANWPVIRASHRPRFGTGTATPQVTFKLTSHARRGEACEHDVAGHARRSGVVVMDSGPGRRHLPGPNVKKSLPL